MRITSASIRAFSSLALLAALAGCSGGSQSTLPSGTMPGAQQLAFSLAPDASPDKCVGTGGVEVIPCKLTLKNSKQTSVTVSGPGVLNSKMGTTCNAYGKFHYFDYGIWYVVPVKKVGTCTVTFTGEDSNGKPVGTAKLSVNNTY